MSSAIQFTFEEYQAVLRNDFASFIERTFHELNPQANFVPGQYIDPLCGNARKVPHRADETTDHQSSTADTEVPCRHGRIFGLAARPRSIEADHLCQLWAGSGR